MNLWRGFVVEPRRGDWGLLKDHVLRVICCGDMGHFDYLLNLAARMFQEPQRQGEVATIIRGAKGAGEGIFLGPLVGAWGQHGLHITSAKHLIGHFNDHLRDCVALFADEAFFAGDKQHEGILKGLITETTIMIERKRFDAVPVANMLHIWMSSDSDWVVPATVDERRFYVLDAADNRVGWDWMVLRRLEDRFSSASVIAPRFMIPSGSRHQRPKRMLPRNRPIPRQPSMLSQINRRRRRLLPNPRLGGGSRRGAGLILTFRGIMADEISGGRSSRV